MTDDKIQDFLSFLEIKKYKIGTCGLQTRNHHYLRRPPPQPCGHSILWSDRLLELGSKPTTFSFAFSSQNQCVCISVSFLVFLRCLYRMVLFFNTYIETVQSVQSFPIISKLNLILHCSLQVLQKRLAVITKVKMEHQTSLGIRFCLKVKRGHAPITVVIIVILSLSFFT